MKLSEIYHMDIYSDNGQFLGEVQDIIINLENGEVSRLLTAPLKSAKSNMRALLKQSVLYKNVKNVGDVVLVSAPAPGMPEASKEELNELSR